MVNNFCGTFSHVQVSTSSGTFIPDYDFWSSIPS